jgi:hypothetical protein
MSALVYDIGPHDGRVTGHYLREGSRVVALDANPTMCAAAEAIFAISFGLWTCRSRLPDKKIQMRPSLSVREVRLPVGRLEKPLAF